MNTYTIHDIKRLTSETSPYFFSRDNMKFFGQTLKDFKVSKIDETHFLIQASSWGGVTKRIFNSKTNELEMFEEVAE